MSCKYKGECPSYSGWCEGLKQDFSRCIPFLITAYDNAKEKLKKYEDIGLTPEQLLKVDEAYRELAEEVAGYRKEGGQR